MINPLNLKILFINFLSFITEDSISDRLINTNRVHISQLRGRKKPTSQQSTEPEAIGQAFGGRLDSTTKGGFGARQTTTANNIEDD